MTIIQNLSIHFKKGVQYLNGADAMRVVRFRHNYDGTGYGSEDLGRMQTQQKFLKAVAKKMLTASNIDKIDDHAKIFNQYARHPLSVGNLAWLGTEVLKMGVDKIDFSTLPNGGNLPYLYLIGRNSDSGEYLSQPLCGGSDRGGSASSVLTSGKE